MRKRIKHDKTGFIAGKFIGETTRMTYDKIKFTEDMNKPGMLLMIDFEKRFDFAP